jgi:hypothetical protein
MSKNLLKNMTFDLAPIRPMNGSISSFTNEMGFVLFRNAGKKSSKTDQASD